MIGNIDGIPSEVQRTKPNTLDGLNVSCLYWNMFWFKESKTLGPGHAQPSKRSIRQVLTVRLCVSHWPTLTERYKICF